MVLHDMLRRLETESLVDRHLKATSRTTGSDVIYVQTTLQKRGSSEGSVLWDAQWQLIRSLCHELLHVIVHPKFRRASVEDSMIVKGGAVEVPGMDFFNYILSVASISPKFADELTDNVAVGKLPDKVGKTQLGYGDAAQ